MREVLKSLWQNGHVDRLIGSIRRESLDHLIVFGEAHLRQILKAYSSYYNEVRTLPPEVWSILPRRAPSSIRPGLGFGRHTVFGHLL